MRVGSWYEAPDWSAIDAAHAQAEALQPIESNSMPIGFLPLSVMFEQADLAVLPIEERRPIGRKTNGFGGRSKTRRASPHPRQSVEQPSRESLGEQIARLDELRAEVEREIEDPDRDFVKWLEIKDFEGNIDFKREYIYDPEEIGEIKTREKEAMKIVVEALRVGIFERHPRTRGFPSPRRMKKPEGAHHNVTHLRSPKNSESEYAYDPLVQALLADLEKRLVDPDCTTTISTSRYWQTRVIPQWQNTYMPTSFHYSHFATR